MKVQVVYLNHTPQGDAARVIGSCDVSSADLTVDDYDQVEALAESAGALTHDDARSWRGQRRECVLDAMDRETFDGKKLGLLYIVAEAAR